MPYSTHPPPAIFPDTSKGRLTAARFIGGDCDVEFCPDYAFPFGEDALSTSEGGTVWRGRCDNRRIDGDRQHNWCFRCICGFLTLDKGEEIPA